MNYSIHTKQSEDDKRQLEVEKLSVEIKKIKRDSNWFRIPLTSWLTIIPGVALVYLSYVIAVRNNLLESKKIQYTQSQFIQDSTNVLKQIKVERELMEAADAKRTVQEQTKKLEETKIKLLNSNDSLAFSIFSLKQLNNKISNQNDLLAGNIRKQKAQINKLYSTKLQLEDKNRFANWDYDLDLFKEHPDVNGKSTLSIIRHITNNGIFRNRLLDSLTAYNIRYPKAGVYYYMLYECTSDPFYKNGFIENFEESLFDSSIRFFNSDYLSLFTAFKWTSEDKYEMSKVLINFFWQRQKLTKLLTLQLLGILKSFSLDYNFKLQEYDYDLFKKAVLLNYNLLNYPDSSYSAEDYTQIVENIALLCPQIYMAKLLRLIYDYNHQLAKSRKKIRMLNSDIYLGFLSFFEFGYNRLPYEKYRFIESLSDGIQLDKLKSLVDNEKDSYDIKKTEKALKQALAVSDKWVTDNCRFLKSNREDVLKLIKLKSF